MFRNLKMNHKELITWAVQNQPLKNEPGPHYAYSNFGYCILGRVLERVSGQSYATFVHQAGLKPCGIQDMQLAGNSLAQRAPQEVLYYGPSDNPYNMNVTRMDSHGGWIGTPSDLVRFELHVDDFDTTPSILRKETIRTMTTSTAANEGYACGWCVNRFRNYWHNGSLPGTTSILVRTASGLCWAAFANARSEGVNLAIDQMMWKVARAVPAWRA
jgi:CubicO group peptidase (beta-lactamase class C family)